MSDSLMGNKVPEPNKLPFFVATEEDLRVCPLCRHDWVKVEETEDKGHAYFACFNCEISIWVRDPLLGRWRNIEKEPCPVCTHKDTRVFFRSDGYLKFRCPKCKLTIENVDEKRHDALIKAEEKAGTRWLPPAVKKRLEQP